MNKLLADTRLVAAFAALVLVCVTVLVALNKVAWPDAVKTMSGFLGGLLLAWQRGAFREEPTKVVVDCRTEEKKP